VRDVEFGSIVLLHNYGPWRSRMVSRKAQSGSFREEIRAYQKGFRTQKEWFESRFYMVRQDAEMHNIIYAAIELRFTTTLRLDFDAHMRIMPKPHQSDEFRHISVEKTGSYVH